MRKYLIIMTAALAAAVSCTKYDSVKGDPMESRIYTLDNGLKIYMTVNKDEPRIQTYIAVRVGGKDDPADNTGLAHYLEHMMFKGTQLFGTQDYEAEKPLLASIDSLYEVYRTLTEPAEREALYHQIDSISYEASKLAIPNEYDKLMSIIGSEGSNAYTSNDVTCYVEEIPSNQLDAWARIEADRFRNCVFRGFHTELEAVYEEKNMSLTDDGEKAMDALDSMLFARHPYGTQTVIGTQDHLKNPSLLAIRKQKDTWYVPNNIAICLSGDFDPDEVVATIKKYFGDWEPNRNLPERNFQTVELPGEPQLKEIVGNEAEFVMMGWRTPGASDKDCVLSEIAGSILSNGMAGLMDIDLIQSQALRGGVVFPYNRTEAGLFLVEGVPQEGQKLEDVRDLLLGEIGKLAKGEFSDTLLQAVKANYKLEQMKALTSNRGRAHLFVDSFVNGTKWSDEVGKMARVEAITKEEIVDWASEYLKAENYSAVFKRLGEDLNIKKIDAPKITPIVTNRDKQSAFLQEIAAIEPSPIEPVFVDYEKDLSVLGHNGLEFLYKKNEKNDIASLSFRFDRGSDNDPLLPHAATYLEYLGTADMRADQINSELYSLACEWSLNVGANTTVVKVSGLSENIGKALGIVERLLGGAIPDEAVLAQLKMDILRGRADAKKNQRACNGALQNYLIFGKDYIHKKTLSNEALTALSSEDLLGSVKDLLGKQHRILYYGPESPEKVLETLDNVHKSKDLAPLQKTYAMKQQTPKSYVLLAPYPSRQFNYVQYSNRGESFDLAEDPCIELFNEYYGGGMNAIVFQEMRESRALAYSAGAWLSTPSFKTDSYSFRAFIASQNDKLRKAVEGFDEIIETLPEAPENLEIAKAAILSRLRTGRTIGEAVLYSYLNAKELGLDEPLEKQLYEKVGELTMEDLLATHAKWIKGRSYTYGILGDPKDLDLAYLKTLGELRQVSLEEIFGY